MVICFATGLAVAWLIAPGLGSSALILASRFSAAPAHPSATQRVSAPADRVAVLDGDTVRVGDRVVRLRGIAAPSRGWHCRTVAGTTADCGVSAANALAALLRGSWVDCTVLGHDTTGRPVADCRCGTVALSEAMIRDGWARAQSGFADLQQAEEMARVAGRGIWRDPDGS